MAAHNQCLKAVSINGHGGYTAISSFPGFISEMCSLLFQEDGKGYLHSSMHLPSGRLWSVLEEGIQYVMYITCTYFNSVKVTNLLGGTYRSETVPIGSPDSNPH